MAGGTAGDESWGFWFRHHWLRYGFVALSLFVNTMAAGELLQFFPRPLEWYMLLTLGAMLAGFVVFEVLLYRWIFPGHLRGKL
jgi:hypothetical protein